MKITVETTIAGPIEQVWSAYTTPADIMQWNAASDDWHSPAASVDLREGGKFSARMEAKDGSEGFDFVGTYTKIEKHKLIEYDFFGRTAQIAFTEAPEGVNVCVTFDAETVYPIEQQREGWQAILNNFKRHVEASVQEQESSMDSKDNHMTNLTLYTNPQSRGRIAHWMMEELGEPYETVWLDYATTMQAPEYLAVNPMGKVPALKHGDTVITEAAAICTYLADRFPEKGLIPPANDPARGTFFRWLFFAAGPLEQAVTVKSQKWPVTPEQEGFLGFGNYDKTITALEAALQPGPYICGDQFTAADVYVGSHIGWGMLFGTIEKRPLFETYVERLYARSAYQQANQINEERIKQA